MDLDNPRGPEFASWQSYRHFAQRVRRDRRYIWRDNVQAFLDTVLATLKQRDRTISTGNILYRAQRGARYEPVQEEEGNGLIEILGFGPERMKPRSDRAMQGRANPSGIPVLYLATQADTAIAEVRPWIGSEVSVAQFKTTRDLRIVDLSLGHGETAIGQMTFAQLFGEKPISADDKEKAVWIDIDSAFSRPITLSDDVADYVPTQILAELFRDVGYDGIVYRSQFGQKGYNIALFDLNNADPVNCAPYQVKRIELHSEEIGNRWYSRKRSDKATE